MTDVQLKLEEEVDTSGVLIPNEAIMISNLPLLFAGGYPTCLEKFSLRQIEKFVPFMLQCSMGKSYLDKYTQAPKWWPEDIPFSMHIEKPSEMDDSRWFATLKSIVCRCYTYHDCEFMLRFCTELSDCPITTYRFVESWDGTTSLYNKETGRLMVTFRNENRDYDKEVEASSRRSLLPRNSTQSSSRLMVQPPTFDIYLCDNCDGEFDSLTEVQEHERNCTRRQAQDGDVDYVKVAVDEDGARVDPLSVSQEFAPEEAPPEQLDQDAFLHYFRLRNASGKDAIGANLSITSQAATHAPRFPRGLSTPRCSSIPFSSPLGKYIQKQSRLNLVKPQLLLNRVERYCLTKLRGPNSRMESKSVDTIEWPITYKSPHPKKSQEIWSHFYSFSRRERLALRSARGLNWRSRRLLSRCREVHVLVRRLTEEEIYYRTARVQTPESPVFHLPTLIPNTMYTYHTNMNDRPGYPQKIEVMQNPSVSFSPDPMIPVIDLVSTDDEGEGVEDLVPASPQSIPEMNFKQSLHGIEEDEQVYSDRNSNTDLSVYPFIATSTYGTYTPVRYGTSSPSESQSWHMNICIKSPSQVSTHIACEEQPYHLQRKISPEPLQVFEHEVDSIVGAQLYQCSPPSSQTKVQYSTTPYEIIPVSPCQLSDGTRSKLPFSHEKKDVVSCVPVHSASLDDECDILEIQECKKKSHHKRESIKSQGTATSNSKNGGPSIGIFPKENYKSGVPNRLSPLCVNIDDDNNDDVDISVTKTTHHHRLENKVINSTSSIANVLESCRSKASSALKTAFAQSGNGTTTLKPLNCDSNWNDGVVRHSKLSVHRKKNKQLASNDTSEAVEIILDDDNRELPSCKKMNLNFFEDAVPALTSTKQDTSNNDIFGMSVKHEKATQSYHRCLANRRLLLSIPQLHQDHREMKTRGLHNVMNMEDRIFQRHSEDKFDHLVDFGKKCDELKFCGIKNEAQKCANVSHTGKVVVISLMDNEVELIGSNLVDNDVSSLENRKCWVPSEYKTSDVASTKVKANINCESEKEIKRTVSTHSCPSLKIEQPSANVLTSSDFSGSINSHKYNSTSWNCLSYSSPMVMLNAEPEQTLKCVVSNSGNSQSCKSKQKGVKIKCVESEYLSNVHSNVKLNSHNCFSSDNFFEKNNEHCFKRHLSESSEFCGSFKMVKSTATRSKKFESSKALLKKDLHSKHCNINSGNSEDLHSKCCNTSSENSVESCKRNLGRPRLVLQRYEYSRQCKNV